MVNFLLLSDKMTKDHTDSLLSMLGADIFAPLLTDTSQRNLVELLDGQIPLKLPDFSQSVSHDKYSIYRGEFAKRATLAALAQDNRLDVLVGEWVELQQKYARQVIKEIKVGIQDQEDLLQAADEELQQGQAIIESHAQYQRMRAGDLDEAGLQKLIELRKQVQQLEKTREHREQLHRIVAGYSMVEQTLTTMIKSGTQAIHYVIPSVKEIQDRLGRNAYDGPDFQPFLLSVRVEASDTLFLRNKGVPTIKRKDPGDIDTTDLPAVLRELVGVYEHIMDQTPGTTINPTKIKDNLALKILGAKGIGSYLEDHGALFGVEKKGGQGQRMFVRRESGQPVSRKLFLDYILDGHLQSQDAKPVNDFYFQKALALLRERPDAYEGFTKITVQTIAENNKFPVGKIYIARNLRDTEGIKVVAPEQGSEPEKYAFESVVPTELQLKYALEAVAEFGISRFTPDELARRVHGMHKEYRISTFVAEAVLDQNHTSWSLKLVEQDPVRYQMAVSSQKTSAKKNTSLM